ncbi:MAG TPA: hypothetical protein VK680_12110, partial [Solirubrobacteraceae bacterium]|nr:hypothetical protein [Solirubrobacteraceae bacterium]
MSVVVLRLLVVLPLGFGHHAGVLEQRPRETVPIRFAPSLAAHDNPPQFLSCGFSSLWHTVTPFTPYHLPKGHAAFAS